MRIIGNIYATGLSLTALGVLLYIIAPAFGSRRTVHAWSLCSAAVMLLGLGMIALATLLQQKSRT